jgi:hypothetical protein
MLRGESNPYPIQLLVNYWEIRPSQMGARLNELLRMGVTHVASFVPWQAVESDIAHTLPRFLQALTDRKMTVSLILTPELGVHYLNSGLPKDIFSKGDNIARSARGGSIPAQLPPNAFSLPSLIAPEFAKRYHNFLSRMDSLLADLGRNQPHLLEGVTTVLTGSFWKYYRAPESSTGDAFAGMCGDFSSAAALAYRQRLDQFFQSKEFAESAGASGNRWKTRGLEEVNRRWFQQQSEDVFRNRSSQFVRRKAGAVALSQVELFTPEADPGFLYSAFLQLITGGRSDFSRLSDLVDEYASRATHVGDDASPSYVHWTGLGGFQTLSDPEKQFLILKSLLLMAGRGGGILVSEKEWFGLSQSFRSRAESLARMMLSGELRLRTRAFYLSPHLWSGAGTLWDELVCRTGYGARLISSMDLALADSDATLLLVDPGIIVTRELIQKFHAWASRGGVVVLPQTPLFTDAASEELQEILGERPSISMELGIPYRIYNLGAKDESGAGKFITYRLPEGFSMHGESATAWQTFLGSMLSVADVKTPCSVTDTRLSVIALDPRDGDTAGLFILNGSSRSVAGDLVFSEEVSVSDLASAFSPERRAGSGSVPANRFALEVPPSGILPIAARSSHPRESVASAETKAAALGRRAPREGSTEAQWS